MRKDNVKFIHPVQENTEYKRIYSFCEIEYRPEIRKGNIYSS